MTWHNTTVCPPTRYGNYLCFWPDSYLHQILTFCPAGHNKKTDAPPRWYSMAADGKPSGAFNPPPFWTELTTPVIQLSSNTSATTHEITGYPCDPEEYTP